MSQRHKGVAEGCDKAASVSDDVCIIQTIANEANKDVFKWTYNDYICRFQKDS